MKLFIELKLMASQLGGLYQTKNDRTSAYLDIMRAQAGEFESVDITLKTRNDIQHVDTLA